jgi:integrase
MMLNAANVKNTKPAEKRQEIPDDLCTGLYLVVQPTGKRGWQVRYRHGGVHRRMTIGRYPILSLADARQRARDVLAAVAEGRDPAEEARAAKAPAPDSDKDKFSAVVALFLKRHASHYRRGDDVAAYFRREVLDRWGERDIHAITKRDVIDVLDGIVDRGSPSSANRMRTHLNTLFNWAKGRDIVQVNPLDGIKPPAPETSRDRVLADDEMRLFWRACDALGEPFGPLFQLLLLTAQRRGEVAGMTDDEIAGDEWIIPSARTKNGDQHSVPLSKEAQSLLHQVKRIKGPVGYIFTTTGERPVSGFSRAATRLHRKMVEIATEDAGSPVEIAPFTVHDLRRTAATGMAGLGFPPHIVEAVLNHRSGTRRGVAGVYNRFTYSNEKRQALAAWARFVLELVEGSDDVTAPRRH